MIVQNLPTPPPVYPTRIKADERTSVVVLSILTLLAGTATWYFVHHALQFNVLHVGLRDLGTLLATFASFFFLFGFAAMIGLLVHDSLISKAILAVAVLPFFVWFAFSGLAFIGFLLVLVALWLYDWNLKGAARGSIKFSTASAVKGAVGIPLMLLLIAISVLYYARVHNDTNVASSPVQTFVDGAAATTNRLLATQIKGYNPDESLDDFLLRLAVDQAQKDAQKVGVQVNVPESTKGSVMLQQVTAEDLQTIINALPESVRKQVGSNPEAVRQELLKQSTPVIEDGVARAREQFVANLGITADGSTPIGDVVRSFLQKQVETYITPYERFIPTLLALSLYFTLQIFSFVYTWIITLLAMAIFGILRAAGVVRIHEVQAPVQVATLSKDL